MSKMGVLRRERRKWEELKRSSKSLSKRYASTKIYDDQEEMFCSDRRKLDRELQVARNMVCLVAGDHSQFVNHFNPFNYSAFVQNPRLRDPLPFEQQYFSTFAKSYNKRTAQACDVYDVNRIARRKVCWSTTCALM